MSQKHISNFKSLRAARFLMKIIGMWPSENSRENTLSKMTLIFWINTMFVAACITGVNIYVSIGSIHALSDNVPTASIVYSKGSIIICFIYYRQKLFSFSRFTVAQFWNKTYGVREIKILKNYDQMITYSSLMFSIIVQMASGHYVLSPIMSFYTLIITLEGSWSKNLSERVLAFPLHFNLLPYYETPYYEIISCVEAAATLSVGLVTISETIFMFTINVNASAQFKLLQLKIEDVCEFRNTENEAYFKLKQCIKQHQLLIRYVKEIDTIYRYISLCQLLSFITQICFSGVQLLMGGISQQSPVISLQFLFGSFLELYFFTWSSHQIIIHSLGIHYASYCSRWYDLLYRDKGKDFRTALNIIMLRSSRPCIVSCGKFYPMNLDMFSYVIKTSLSYFTVLRKTLEKV